MGDDGVGEFLWVGMDGVIDGFAYRLEGNLGRVYTVEPAEAGLAYTSWTMDVDGEVVFSEEDIEGF